MMGEIVRKWHCGMCEQGYRSKEDADKCCELEGKAYDFAEEKHKGQLDDAGNSYFESHIKQVAKIIKQVTRDKDIIAAAYLHDTLEDTKTTLEELKTTFNERVANIVYEVTHEGKKDEKGYWFPRLKSKDAILVKFSDRLSNLSRMDVWDEERQQHYLKKSKFWKSEPDKK